MIDFKDEERKIIITLRGSREDYTRTLKTLLFMLGNQDPENPLSTVEIAQITHLISEILPCVNNLTREYQEV